MTQMFVGNDLKQNFLNIVDRSTISSEEKESFRHIIFPPVDPSAHGVGEKRRRED
jgi:hypothetical protein